MIGNGLIVVIDISGVTYVDSAGVATLLRAKNGRTGTAVDVRIKGAAASVVRVFDILGLLPVLG